MEDMLLDVEQLARRWGLRTSTIYKFSMSGKIPVVKIMGSLRFKLSAIEEFEEKSSRPALTAASVR